MESQTRWLADELPALLQAQADLAIAQIGSVGGPSANGRAASDESAQRTTAASAVNVAAQTERGESVPSSPVRRKGIDVAVLTSPLRSSPAAEILLSKSPSKATVSAQDVAPVAAPAEFADAQAALVGVAQSALIAAQKLASAKASGDPAAIAAAQEGLLAAASAALEFAGKPAEAAGTVAPKTYVERSAPPMPMWPFPSVVPPAEHGNSTMPAPPVPPAWLAWYHASAYGGGQPPPLPRPCHFHSQASAANAGVSHPSDGVTMPHEDRSQAMQASQPPSGGRPDSSPYILQRSPLIGREAPPRPLLRGCPHRSISRQPRSPAPVPVAVVQALVLALGLAWRGRVAVVRSKRGAVGWRRIA